MVPLKTRIRYAHLRGVARELGSSNPSRAATRVEAIEQDPMCRTSELVDQLSPEERASLKSIATGICCPRIPFEHAEKFIRLGLAELNCGDQALTRRGKRACGMIGA